MKHYIKEIFEKDSQEKRIHGKFIRYSKGNFTGPLIKIKKQKDSLKIKSSFHIVDELLWLATKYTSEKDVNIKGTISYNMDLSAEFEELGLKYMKVSKSRGIYKYQIDNVVNIDNFVNKMADYNPLLSFTSKNVKITTKKSFPKPNKEITNNFCYLELPLEAEEEIYSNFCFDIDERPKDIDISHTIIIDEIVFPDKKDISFEQLRRESQRKGTIKRELQYNGNHIKKEKSIIV